MTPSPVTTPPLYSSLKAHTINSNKKIIKAIANVLVRLESIAYPEEEHFPLKKKVLLNLSLSCWQCSYSCSDDVWITWMIPWQVLKSLFFCDFYVRLDAFKSGRKAGDNDILERCESSYFCKSIVRTWNSWVKAFYNSSPCACARHPKRWYKQRQVVAIDNTPPYILIGWFSYYQFNFLLLISGATF